MNDHTSEHPQANEHNVSEGEADRSESSSVDHLAEDASAEVDSKVEEPSALSPSLDAPTTAMAPKPPIQGYYRMVSCAPNFPIGICIACKQRLNWPFEANFADNSSQVCPGCGAHTFRLDSIRESLASGDSVTWSYLTSNFYIWDEGVVSLGTFIKHSPTVEVERWLNLFPYPNSANATRYSINIIPIDGSKELYLFPNDSYGTWDTEDEIPAINFNWFRFGISNVSAVPAWRQALFGAVTLLPSNPAAAVVLIAAGFEAFFNDRVRIAWLEKGMDPESYRRLNDRNLGIANIIGWLPGTVGLPNFTNAPDDLHKRWSEAVNGRRNAVVHRANVHVTSDEALESLSVAVESITFLDKHALTRPHPFFVSR